jgi:hypothetical protein
MTRKPERPGRGAALFGLVWLIVFLLAAAVAVFSGAPRR